MSHTLIRTQLSSGRRYSCLFYKKLNLGDYIAEVFFNLEYYFFGSVAFKTNAKKPAGINPVVSNNLNFIPKSGM